MVAQSSKYLDCPDGTARDIAETQARLAESRSEVMEHIARSRRLIQESRELMARADAVLERVLSWGRTEPS